MRLFPLSSDPDAWADASFRIEGSEHEDDGVVYRLASRHGVRRVGLDVWVRDWMEPLSWDGEKPVCSAYRGGVLLRSQGARSDRFLKALAKGYQHQGVVRAMRSEVPATAIVLDADAGSAKIKLFFNDREEDDEGMYAELFLNIDAAGRRIELAEKDPEYRQGVMGSLGVPGNALS